ncbi:MAG: response regulator [Mojavia pulchra JT2-VF2]|jgi:DNA-binding response OmpR family regulator|uniref:Response regulator n=1 Tax=Mojavia pulchra JT2-VF2 TaxID=287848 RepID=A0A951PX67_9NOST|nr:response regulator [Mojavia pulchra JT2-VF2]
MINALSIHQCGLRLLIIDDHADTRELLKILFETEGYEIKAAATASEALNVMSGFLPDIVISEIYLPDEAGHLLLAKVRNLEAARDRWIPAIALTAFAKEEDRAYALEAGFQMYLSKPVILDELVCVVTNLFRRIS